ncbi:putative beta-glucosidase G [Glarea lozoyensis 74030]|uniref:Probable beta-glucosidase G n=1 Tax=Glarea lozoyensis (strain ATCC 74030 / MF5533) TaxID=1104152 RepID=H0EC87_GLAL7|nr:putative beta-glucosidase G [Glarea lozoyensis 74030]
MVTGQPGPCIGNIVGIPRLNFSGLCLQDGPASLRIANYASSFPSGVTIASSWDKKMLYERGLAMGREFKGKGAHVALAPVAGPLGRSAYCGLNWEGFSPDPYLTGIAMQESVLGLQDAGVQATAKHFILNEQEILRNAFSFPNGSVQYEAISSNVDDRTLREITEGPINQDIFEFGTLAVGGGSGAAQFSYLISPLQAIKERALETGAIVEAWLNNTYVSQVTETAITGAGGILLANTPDVCLVFLKGWASEGVDRETLDLDWSANEVVEAVAGACNNTVVITHSSGINDLPWADHPNVTAILVAHYPGQESGNSIVDVLYGDVNPSGHLPYTIAFNGSDYNSPVVTSINTTGSDDWQSYFTERLEIDYRFLTPKILMFAMNLADGQITSHAEELETQPGGNPALWEVIYTANVVVYNTGDVRGNVVPQLYVSFPSSTPAGTPLRQLRGFEKVELTSGQRASVDFELMRRDLSYWDINSQQWLIPEGEFTLHVGLSSRDLHGSTIAGRIERAQRLLLLDETMKVRNFV